MTDIPQTNFQTMLSGATDPENDQLSVVEIQGTALTSGWNQHTFLTDGGRTLTVFEDPDAPAIITFADNDPLAPSAGETISDSYQYTVSDGTNTVEVVAAVEITGESGLVPSAANHLFTVNLPGSPVSQTNGAGLSVQIYVIGSSIREGSDDGAGSLASLYSIAGQVLDFGNPTNGNNSIDVTVLNSGGGHALLRVWDDGVIHYVVETGETAHHPASGTFDLVIPYRVGSAENFSAEANITIRLAAAGANVAPSVTTGMSIAPASGPVGTTFVFNPGAASGSPTPTASVSATLGGSAITLAGPDGSGNYSYVSTAEGAIAATTTWSNGVGTPATSSANATVSASGGGGGTPGGPTTAEFGADTPAGSGGFQPVDSAGDPYPLTSYNSLVSGSLGGYTPSIVNGRLVFNATGAPNGAVLRCGRAGGTVDITVSSVANARSAATLSEARTAAQAYIAAAPTSTNRHVILRAGQHAATNDFNNLRMSGVTRITGLGARGSNPALAGFDGGHLTIRSEVAGMAIIVGNTTTSGSRGIEFRGIGFANVGTVPTYEYEPETPSTITAATAGNPTTITIAASGFDAGQIQPGDRLNVNSMPGGWSAMEGQEITVLSATPASGGGSVAVSLQYNSSGHGNYTSGGRAFGSQQSGNAGTAITVNDGGGFLPLVIFRECKGSNGKLTTSPGLYGTFMETVNCDEVAVLSCDIDGADFVFSRPANVTRAYYYDNMITNVWGDFFPVRDAVVNNARLARFATVSVTGISKGATTTVTASGHGLETGDSVALRSVGGMTQANGEWYVGATTANTFVLQQESPATVEKHGRRNVNSSAWGNYTSGGTAYIRPGPEIWIVGNYCESANDPSLKAKHSDGVQGSRGNQDFNQRWAILDNVFNLWTLNGFATQPILGKGGAHDATYIEGDIRGNFCIGGAPNCLYAGACRTGKGEIRFNTAIRDGQTNSSSPALARLHGAPNPLTGNIIGRRNPQSPTPTVEDNLEVDHDATGPSYNDVFAGTFVADAGGWYRCAAIKGLTGDRASRIAAVKAALTPNVAYKSYGATADPQGRYYVP